VGGSLGLAILSTLAADKTASVLGNSRGGPLAAVSATVAGYHVAFWAAAIMLAAGAVLLVVLLRPRHLAAVSTDPNAAMVAA
jgi:hypothetical protein